MFWLIVGGRRPKKWKEASAMYKKSRVNQGVRALDWCEAEENQKESIEVQ